MKRLLELAAELETADVQAVPHAVLQSHLLNGDENAWFRILKKLKIEPTAEYKPLGGGDHGSAYAVGGKCLKLTSDPTEAMAAATLKKHPMREAYKVFAVYRVGGFDKVFVLFTELLAELDTEYLHMLGWWQLFSKENSDGKRYRVLTPENVRYFVEWMNETNAKQMPSKVCLTWLTKAAKNLTDRGITHGDFHFGNVMKRPNGEHVVIDIGSHSQAPDHDLAEAGL